MKKIIKKSLMFPIFFSMLLLNIPETKAYTTEELNELKEIAKHVDISYDLDDTCRSQDGEEIKGTYQIHIANMTNQMYARIEDEYKRTTDIYYYEDKNLSQNGCISGGNLKITIYAQGTQNKLYNTNLYLDKYNYYADREECQNVNIEEVKVCDPWYQGNLTEKMFQDALKSTEQIAEEPRIIDIIFNFLSKYKYYAISLTTVVIIGIATLYNRKKKGDLL